MNESYEGENGRIRFEIVQKIYRVLCVRSNYHIVKNKITGKLKEV